MSDEELQRVEHEDHEKIDQFLQEKTDSINTLGITDPVDEEFLKEICEDYYKLKKQQSNQCHCLDKQEIEDIAFEGFEQNNPKIMVCLECESVYVVFDNGIEMTVTKEGMEK